VARMKFIRLLRPEVPMEIIVAPKGPRSGPEFRAEFRDRDGVVASANLTLRRAL